MKSMIVLKIIIVKILEKHFLNKMKIESLNKYNVCPNENSNFFFVRNKVFIIKK